MDEAIKLLDAKPSDTNIDSNIGVWHVEKGGVFHHFHKLYLLGLLYPSLFSIVGNDLYFSFQLESMDHYYFFVIKDQNPENIKHEIIAAFQREISAELAK